MAIMDAPTKTFLLSTPMDVFIKLEFDLARLKRAVSTKDLQFAAIDLAVWGFHMVDWVLNTVSDEKHTELTGKVRKGKKITDGFIERQSMRVGTLEVCRQIANTGKHRVLTQSDDNPSFVTRHTIRFEPAYVVGEEYRGRMFAQAYLKDTTTGQEVDAVVFFNAMVEQWRGFLKAHGLYDWDYNYQPDLDDLEEDQPA